MVSSDLFDHVKVRFDNALEFVIAILPTEDVQFLIEQSHFFIDAAREGLALGMDACPDLVVALGEHRRAVLFEQFYSEVPG